MIQPAEDRSPERHGTRQVEICESEIAPTQEEGTLIKVKQRGRRFRTAPERYGEECSTEGSDVETLRRRQIAVCRSVTTDHVDCPSASEPMDGV
jgi:hypothetical protein